MEPPQLLESYLQGGKKVPIREREIEREVLGGGIEEGKRTRTRINNNFL